MQGRGQTHRFSPSSVDNHHMSVRFGVLVSRAGTAGMIKCLAQASGSAAWYVVREGG